jgi:hypothetical protein
MQGLGQREYVVVRPRGPSGLAGSFFSRTVLTVTSKNNVHRTLLIALLIAVLGCGAEKPTAPPFGEELSVAEQVAVEAAFVKVADSLYKVRKTADDSLIADFTLVAARLVRLEGRYGTISVTLPGATSPVTMRAIAGTGKDATISSETVSFVLAWQDLDAAAFTMKRALIVQEGGFGSTLAAQVRYFDMAGTPSAGTYIGGGNLTLSAQSFTAPCQGLGSTAGATCRAGKVTAATTATASLNGTGTASDVSFAATPLAGFEVVVQ